MFAMEEIRVCFEAACGGCFSCQSLNIKNVFFNVIFCAGFKGAAPLRSNKKGQVESNPNPHLLRRHKTIWR